MRLLNELLGERLADPDSPAGEPEFTGRYLVLLHEDAGPEAEKALSSAGDMTVATASTEAGEIKAEEIRRTDCVIFSELGVALVDVPPPQIQTLGAATASTSSPIMAVQRERVLRALSPPPATTTSAQGLEVSVEYRRGYRDAILDLTGRTGGDMVVRLAEEEAFVDTDTTWGLQAVGIGSASGTGKGMRVAVLDTGFFLEHPDFTDRTIVTESFVSGETVDDVAGHGTHCIGTACGPREPKSGPRYGVAFEADIYVGKVLNNQGSGAEGGIIAGIDWARRNGCEVISMSLGGPVLPNQPPSSVFETVAKRALDRGSLIVAAAGNDSERQAGRTEPVSYPANCPSIIAVAAVDERLQVASFSNQGINPQGGEVDLAAPGVNVHSSWPHPRLYRSINGTSMATPHVAGVAALYAEKESLRGWDLYTRLRDACKDINLAEIDVGAGLVQAPSAGAGDPPAAL